MIQYIQEAAESVYSQRGPTEIGMTPAQWNDAFERGFMRALTFIGLGSPGLSHIQIQHIANTYMQHSGEPYAKDPEARAHDWVIQAMKAVARIYEERDTVDALWDVVGRAIERGEVPTITLKPLNPLAMGNYQFVIDVRKRSAKTKAGEYEIAHRKVEP